jgi:hypothetical protein
MIDSASRTILLSSSDGVCLITKHNDLKFNFFFKLENSLNKWNIQVRYYFIQKPRRHFFVGSTRSTHLCIKRMERGSLRQPKKNYIW